MASMSLQAAYDQARQSLESNDTDRAIGLAQHILDQRPDNLEAYRILGEAYLSSRQLGRAQESFERVLRSDPENIPAHVGLGITSERQGQLERAIAEFEQALEIKPDMTEIRSQLLRLYADGWGSENAQLRLSRAGLARLYAKGHMLPQAISEFRQVIADSPQRLDAKVALAETLWRDGQEEEAVDLCREILADRPEALKANLLLGYLLKSAGQPEGERYWDAARRMDPYQTVASVLFEPLPEKTQDDPTIEEWDEAAWRGRRAAEQQETLAATRPMEAVTPAGTATEPAGLSSSWLDQLTSSSSGPLPETRTSAAPSPEMDDFLASLLSFDTPSAPAEDTPSSPAAAPADDDMAPFSLADLGLSDEEISGLDTLGAPAETPAQPAPADEPNMTPFSLADLGLSDEEISGLDTLGAPAETPAQPAPADEPNMTPFSLADLGLSDEEISGLGSVGGASTPAPTAEPEPSSEDAGLRPFSLSELGLSDEEIAGLESLQSPSGEAQAGGPSSSLSDDLPADLQPFSMDEIDIDNTAADQGIGGLPSSLQPFSLDEPDPPPQRGSSFNEPDSSSAAPGDFDDDAASEARGYSWQEASQKPEPGFLKSLSNEPESAEQSIFSKLKKKYETSDPPAPLPIPDVTLEPDEHMGLFSMDDISLRDDAQSETPAAPAAEAPAPEIENLDEALSSGQVQPFSLADLGLSPEEIAALEGSPAPAEAPAAEAPAPEIENLDEALSSGQVQPFSLADLGLSPEEIAALEGSTAPAEPPAAEAPAPEIENLDEALSSGQVQPFSLADLGLSPEEIAALEGSPAPAEPLAAQLPIDEPEPAADDFAVEPLSFSDIDEQPPQEPDDSLIVSDLTPFSLADLGLSEEEISALGIGGSDADQGEVALGLTEEELEGLDGGDLNWSSPERGAAPPPPPGTDDSIMVTSGDLVLDRLIALGRQQGYIDISDIIANVEDPEAEADRIEEIGLRLHEAQIEIRDGDEIIDMDAEYSEEEEYQQPEASSPAEPRATYPRDLDLVADEFDVPVGAAAPAPEPPASDEPDMTPFSLADLGLSDEEIAALGLGGAQPEAPAAPAEEVPASDEPNLAPFSLAELGLSDEEIGALGAGGAPPEAPAAPAEEAAAPALPEAAPPTPPAPPAPAPTPVPAAAPAPVTRAPLEAASAFTGNEVLDAFLRQLDSEPDNDVLRLSVARVIGQLGMPDMALKQYRQLIKGGRMLDQIVSELEDMIAYSDDSALLTGLHRALGDALTKQGRLREAVEAYSWTLGGPRGAR